MIRMIPMLAGLLLAGAVLAEDTVKTFAFAKADLGKTPAGWKVPDTGKAAAGEWKVQNDPTAPSKDGHVLTQTASSPKAAFNLCVAETPSATDVEVSVSFKALEGKVDQGGGIVWRYQDAKNYYIARMNPLEDNFRLYKVVDGTRKQLDTKEGLTARAGEWHKISIRMQGDKIECSLDGKKLLTAKDDTFKSKGQVGLWSKADARTSFCQFRVQVKGLTR
jgi:hypothetical protein